MGFRDGKRLEDVLRMLIVVRVNDALSSPNSYSHKTKLSMNTKDNTCAEAECILHIGSAIGKLSAHPVGLEEPDTKMALQAQIDAATDLKS